MCAFTLITWVYTYTYTYKYYAYIIENIASYLPDEYEDKFLTKRTFEDVVFGIIHLPY